MADPEANWYRRQENRFAPPIDGVDVDYTWAFNQATGGRPERFHEDSRDPDVWAPDYPKPHFAMNPRLPSLNRMPGIIYVPPGVYPIHGTIRLFTGQQLVGASAAEGGSTLVKIGDGYCIEVENPGLLGSDRAFTPMEAIEHYYDADRTVDVENARLLLERIAQLAAAGTLTPEAAEALQRGVLDSLSVAHHVQVRVSRLAIRQRDAGRWVARYAGDDRLSNVLERNFESTELPRGPRPSPLDYTSGGLLLASAALSIIEDTTITDFRLGVGIDIAPRTPRNSQSAYYNLVRRCEVARCHRGIVLQSVYGFESATSPLGAEVSVAHNGANSTAITESCVYDCKSAGIHSAAATTTISFCEVRAPAEGGVGQPRLDDDSACVVVASDQNVIYGCRLLSDRRHVLVAQSRVPRGSLKAVEGAAPSHLFEVSGRPSVLPRVFQTACLDVNGKPTPARVETPVYLNRRARTPVRFAPLWMHPGGERLGATVDVIDVMGSTLSPQTSWAGGNLLRNAGLEPAPAGQPGPAFARAAQPAEWTWEPSDVAGPPPLVRFVDGPDVHVSGRAVEITFPPRVEALRAPTLRLLQIVVPAAQAGLANNLDLWRAQSRLRGKRLIAGCWVKAPHRDAVTLVLRQGAQVTRGPGNAQVGEWVFVTSFVDVEGWDDADHTGAAPVVFRIEVTPPAAGNPWLADDQAARVFVAAPQLVIGPHVRPVGPAPLTDQGGRLYGPLELAIGFREVVRLSMRREGQTSALFVAPAALLAVDVGAGVTAARHEADYEVLLYEQGRPPHGLVRFSTDGQSVRVAQALAEPRAMMARSRVALRRIQGDVGPVDVSLTVCRARAV